MAQWKDSIVLLTSSDPANRGFGTGFVFHRDSTGRAFLLTCLHVVEALERTGSAGNGEKPGVHADGRISEVWARGDGVLDLAVLAVEELATAPLTLGAPVPRDRAVETAGYTQYEPAQHSVLARPLTGTVRDRNPVKSLFRPRDIGAWSLDIGIDAELFRELTEGYSGSPVLDPATGQVVGIMNLKWTGTKGHAVCVGSFGLLLGRAGTRAIPGYVYPPEAPSAQPSGGLQPPTRPGPEAGASLEWLASTLDHTDPLDQVAARLDDALAGSAGGLWFYAFHAFRSDCPWTLAEHLAIRFGGLPMCHPGADELVTKLNPPSGEHGLWKALADKITPAGAVGGGGRADEAERILDWINAGPGGGRGRLRVVFCQLPVADKGSRIPDLVAGAIRDFGALSGVRPGARVLFFFACVFEETGLRGLWGRLRPPRLDKRPGCETLGSLAKVSVADLDAWLDELAQAAGCRRRLPADTLRRLRDALEPLFPTDAARLRYRQVWRPACAVLAQATPTHDDHNGGPE